MWKTASIGLYFFEEGGHAITVDFDQCAFMLLSFLLPELTDVALIHSTYGSNKIEQPPIPQ